MIHKIGLDLCVLGGLGTTVGLPTGTGFFRIGDTGGYRGIRSGQGLGIPEGWEHGADTGPQFFKEDLGWRKVEHGFNFFVLGRRARRVHALDLSMLASYYVKPQKFHPGPGYVLFVPVLSLERVSHCVLPVSVSGSARDFLCVRDFPG